MDTVIAANRRYIHGYEALITAILPDYTDTHITNLTSIYIENIKAKVNGVFVTVAPQTINMSGAIGTSYYVNVDAEGKCSVSTTKGNGITSTCIGGFHYGRVRRSTATTDVTVGIVPNSVWTLKYMPSCISPNAMVYIGNNIWGDIYLTRSKSSAKSAGIGGVVYEESAYGALPATGTEGYHQYGFTEALGKVGKRLSFSEEFVFAAEGSPTGLDNANTNAWSATSNTARCTCGFVANAVSSLNICDLVGNVWKWNADKFQNVNGGTSFNWHTVEGGRGDVYGPDSYGLGALISGGNWHNGSHVGSRCVHTNNWPWLVYTSIGAWAVCAMK